MSIIPVTPPLGIEHPLLGSGDNYIHMHVPTHKTKKKQNNNKMIANAWLLFASDIIGGHLVNSLGGKKC